MSKRSRDVFEGTLEERVMNHPQPTYMQRHPGRRRILQFTQIPELPMKKIIQYLETDDKKAMRLVSRSVKHIIDNEVNLLWIVNRKNIFIFEIIEPYFAESHIDIAVDLEHFSDTDEIKNFLTKHMHRIIKVTGFLWMFDVINERECRRKIKVEEIKIIGDVSDNDEDDQYYDEDDTLQHFSPTGLLSHLHFLTHLTLKQLNLSSLKDSVFTMPHLKYLNIEDSIGLECFPRLLSACSSSLEELDLYDIHRTRLAVPKVPLKSLKKLSLCSLPMSRGLVILLSLASHSLEDLSISHTNEEVYDNQNDEEDEEQMELVLNFSNLRKLEIGGEAYQFEVILASELPKLDVLKISRLDLSCMKMIQNYPIHVKELQMSFWKTDKIDATHLQLLGKCAANLECLKMKDMLHVESQISDLLPDQFPKLTKLYICNSAKDITEQIIKRCPNLVHLNMNTLLQFSTGDEFITKLDECLWTLSELTIRDESRKIFMSGLQHKMKLRKLSVNCDLSGLGSLLEACCDTLEELNLSKTLVSSRKQLRIEVGKTPFSMKKLRSVFVNDDVNIYGVFTKGIDNLLDCCWNTVEQLTIANCNPDGYIKSILSYNIYFDNLKILHIHPRPGERMMEEIKYKFPRVQIWTFPPTIQSDILEL